jgi:hypothetical protein
MIRWIFSFFLFALSASAAFAAADDYYHSGIVLYQQRQYEKSIAYFQQAVALDSNHWQSYQAMGQAYYMMGDKATAIAMLSESLRIHPGNPAVRRFMEVLNVQINIAKSLSPNGSKAAEPTSVPMPPPDVNPTLDNSHVFARFYGGYYHSFLDDLNSWQLNGVGGDQQTQRLGLGFRTEVAYSFDAFNAIGISLETGNAGLIHRNAPGDSPPYTQTLNPSLFSASVVCYQFWPDYTGRWYVQIGVGYYSANLAYTQGPLQGSNVSSLGASLGGDTLGASCSLGREIMLTGIVGLNLSASFRYANITQVTGGYSGGSGTQTLAIDSVGELGLWDVKTLGQSGYNAARIDMTGFDLGASLEFDFQ